MKLHCPNCSEGVKSGETTCPQCGADFKDRPPVPVQVKPPSGMVEISLQRQPYDAVSWGCVPGCIVEFAIGLFIIDVAWPVIERHLHGSDIQAVLAHLLPAFGFPAILTGIAALLLLKSRPHTARGFASSAAISVVLGLFLFWLETLK